MRTVAFAVLVITLVSVDAACNDAPSDVLGDAGSGNPDAPIIAITTSPYELVPPFSPTTYDYYVRCMAGDNPLTLSITDANGTSSTALDVVEDQAIVVGGQYWIRCLPHDFPNITVTKHPAR